MHVYDDVAAYADHSKSLISIWVRMLSLQAAKCGWVECMYFSMCTAGVPERVGQKDWQRAGFETLGP